MLDEFPLDVEMPMGVAEDDDFTPFLTAFRIETPYGLRDSGGSEPELSHSLVLSTDAADPAARLHAIIRGRLRFVPANATDPASLELQPLPFEQVQLGERLGVVLLNLVVYSHVEPSAVEEAVDLLLTASGIEPSEIASQRIAFMTGDRWLTAAAGTFIGRPAVDADLDGRRRLDLMMKDRDDFYLNPAHFLYKWPVSNEALAGLTPRE